MIRAAGILFIAMTEQGEAGLLLLRGNGGDYPYTWGLPAGKEEPEDEGDMLATAKREANEEIGELPKGAPTFLMKTICLHQPDAEYPKEDVEFHTYVQRVEKSFTPTLNYEHDGYMWFPLNEVAPQSAVQPATSVLPLAGATQALAVSPAATEVLAGATSSPIMGLSS